MRLFEKDLHKVTQLVSNRARMEPRVLLCECQERLFGPLAIPMAGPLPSQYPVLPPLKSLQSWENGMETGQWELSEMTLPLPESHPVLKQLGPHSVDSSCCTSHALGACMETPFSSCQMGCS